MKKRASSLLLRLCLCLLFPLEALAQPAVTSFNPSSGLVGTLVTISGTSLGSASSVSIGGKSAIIVSNTSTSIVALVMPGATTGVLSVTTGAGTGNGLENFGIVATVYPETQQGNKLVGTNGIGSQQGAAVSISADGNTALVGGFTDNSIMGAAWVFTRSNGTWSQQGTKLLPSGNVGITLRFGKSVALSADGSTAIIGGDTDNSGVGAAWIFTRSVSTWTQQQKLTANDNSGPSLQGASVALSADGNTALIGGDSDNTGIGAGWIFTRSNGAWSQQGSKLVGTGSVGTPGQGSAADLSADGNTALLGGPRDDNGKGAIWVFVRNSGVWTLQGNKLVGANVGNGAAGQGFSIALSADGNTAISGGINDNGLIGVGGAWIFSRTGNTWIEQTKLVGTGASGLSAQGHSVSLSADGNTAAVGGIFDDLSQGATWLYKRNGSTWTQQGSKLKGTGMADGDPASQGSSVALSADGKTLIAGGPSDAVGLGASWIFTAPTLSDDANLSALSLSSGILSPSFSSATLAYSASVSNSTGSVTVTPTRAQANATIEVQVNGGSYAAVSSGTASNALALNVGINTIDVKVTAQDGSTTRSYTLTLTRANLALTITATGPASKIYGTALSAGTSTTNFTITGTLNSGEAVTGVTLTPNAAGISATTAAGAPYVITPSLATGTGGFNASNYTITYVAYNGTVTAAPLTITATGPLKTYGTAVAAGTSATNFTAGTTQNSETVTGVTLTPNAAGLSASTAAGAGYVVTPSLATGAGGFLASNYNITYTPFNGTVATAPLTITATGPAKAYGAVLSAGASTTNFTVGTTQNSQTVTGVTLTPNAAGLSATTAAGAAYVVTPSAAIGSGGFLASNYNITYAPFNGSVTTRTLSVKADDRSKFVGTTLAMGTTAFTPTGLQNSETIGGVTLTSTGSGSSAAIATYPIVVSAATGGTFNASNYSLSYVDGSLSVTNSTNANLSALAISGATLSPVFASGTTAYTATVPNLTTSVTATGTLDDATATLKVNTVTTANGVASAALPLNVGANVISVVVTAQDGTTTKTYQATVTRQASAIADLSAFVVSSGILRPTFASSTIAYTDTVANAISSITVTPTATQANATIRVNGTIVASGAASASIALAVGETIVTTIVTAQDGTTTRTYSTRVFRKGVPTVTIDPLIPNLVSNINVPSDGSIFAKVTGSEIIGNTVVTVTAPYEVSKDGSTGWALSQTYAASSFPTNTSTQKVFVRLTPTTVGAVPASNLSLTTVDGVTKTVALTGTGVSAVSNNADLSSLTSSNYTLSPVFAAATTSYTASVANTVTSVSMVPTAAQANATIKINNVDVTSGSSGTVQLIVGANNISVLVRAQDQTTTKTYTVVITRAAQALAVNEVAPDANGNVTVTTVRPEVKVSSPKQPVTVTVPAGTTNTTVDYSTLITAPGQATVPKTTINSDISKVEIPASTVFTASSPGWDGIIHAPKIDVWTPPASSDEFVTTPGLVIEFGHPTISFSLNKAVRLLLPAQAGMRAAFIHRGVYKEITTVGPSDTQVAGDALPTDEAFKINVGADLVIWTKALSQFITFTQTTDLNVAVVTSDAASITANDIKGANSELNNITTSLANPLPSLGAGGSAITWTSSNPAVVSNNGQTITRPVQGSPFPSVTMTATVKKGRITRTQSFSLTVVPLPNQAPTFTPIANQALCFTTAPQSIAVTGISAGPESGQTTTLSVSSSNPGLLTGLAVNSTTGVITYTPLNTAGGSAIITVTVTDNGGTDGGGVNTFSRTFTITVNALPTVQIFNSVGTNDLSKGLSLTITAAGGSIYSWANASGIISGQNTAALTIRPTVTTTYTVTVTNATGCVNTQSITINVLEDYMALDINNLLSPNGDGVNDALVIKNLDMYPNNTVKIFDVAGRMLYSKQNYSNDWNGSFQGSPLAEGTYYYVVDFGPGKKIIRGFVSIVNQ